MATKDTEYVLVLKDSGECHAIAQAIFVEPPRTHREGRMVQKNERRCRDWKHAGQPIELRLAERSAHAEGLCAVEAN